MLTLMIWEIKKFFKRKITVLTFLTAMIIAAAASAGTSYESRSAVRFSVNGENVYSSEAVALNKALAKEYEGTMSDEKIQNIIERFKLGETLANIQNSESKKIREINGGSYEHNIVTDFVMERMVDEDGHVLKVSDVFKDGPVYFGYSGAYTETVNDISVINMIVIGAVIILTAPVFAEETACKTDRIILSSKYGKMKTAAAKCIAVLFYTIFLYSICAGITVIQNIMIFGTDGAQVSAGVAVYGLGGCMIPAVNVVALSLAAGILTSLLSAFVTLILSSKFSSFLTLIIGLALIFAPILVFQMPISQPVILALIPVYSSQIVQLLSKFTAEHMMSDMAAVMLLTAGLTAVCAGTACFCFHKHQAVS